MQEAFHRLKIAREEAGFADAVSAALRFGWKKPTYTSHENGTRGLRPQVAAGYARAFKVSFEWLLLGTGTKEIGVNFLSPQSRRLVEIFESMTPERREHLLGFMQTQTDQTGSALPPQSIPEGRKAQTLAR